MYGSMQGMSHKGWVHTSGISEYKAYSVKNKRSAKRRKAQIAEMRAKEEKLRKAEEARLAAEPDFSWYRENDNS